MREIKFRAWEETTKRFWSQKEMTEIGGYYYSFGVSDYDGRFVLQQFTGLLDSKGHEIYEGDIVICRNDQEYQRAPSQVVIEPLLGFGTRLTGGMWNGVLSTWINHGCEIIGNIYENPELLNNK